MNPKQKKVAIFGTIALATIVFIVWKRNKNQQEAKALLDFIGGSASQVDLSEATNKGIESIQGTKIDPKNMKIGSLSGAYVPNGAIAKEMQKAVVDFNKSMAGVGTDVKLFYTTLAKIKNKNTLALIDKVYKGVFKESLFEAMKDESALNNVNYAVFSDKTKNDIAIPFLSDGKWAPTLSVYFNNLPTY